MNRIYRLVWSHRQDKFVVTHEKARACGCASSSVAGGVASLLLGGLITGLSGTASAQTAASTLPNGGQVTAGSASISAAGNYLTVQQASQRAAINWQSFSIGKDANYQNGFVKIQLAQRLAGEPSSEPYPANKLLVQAGLLF
ncbi:MAG: ESPR domain-containing protein [Burkholderiales bacterium]|nr:ESPR domain-containing protein [Burkholderiales bacterium]